MAHPQADTPILPEPIGKRIARLRNARGWTQQSLAYRLAASRVAISHIEMDLTVPSERTITLLAGLFKMTPYALVEGTTYPQARSERLPTLTCCYTALETGQACLENDLAWLDRLHGLPGWRGWATEVWNKWTAWLDDQALQASDEIEQQAVTRLREKLNRRLKSSGS